MATKRIKDLTNTAAESDIISGTYFALDGSAGTKKLNSTTLLTKTEQNALAGNVAQTIIGVIASKIFTSYEFSHKDESNIAVDESYVDARGVVYTSSAFAIYESITLQAGESLCVFASGYNDNVSILSTFDGGLYTPVAISTMSSGHGYVYTNTSDVPISVRICSRKTISPVYYIKGFADNYGRRLQEEFDILSYLLLDDAKVINFPAAAERNKYVVGVSGAVADNNSFLISDSITLGSGETIVYEGIGASTNVAMISLYDGATYTPVTRSVDSTARCYSYTNTTDSSQTLRFSYRKTYIPQVYITGKERYNYDSEFNSINVLNTTILGEIMESASVNNMPEIAESDKYVLASNGNVASVAGFVISNSITLQPNETIAYYAKGYLDYVAMISLYDGASYTPVTRSVDSTMQVYLYTNKSNSNQTIRLCYDVRQNYTPLFYVLGKLRYAQAGGDELPELSMFETLGVIGDSYDSGELYLPNGTLIGDVYKKSWPQIAGRKNGVQVTNYTHGGMSTKTWLTNSTYGLAAMNADVPLECYIIRLVKNDVGYFGLDWLGTIDDIHVGQPELNADSFFGCYGKIVEAIKSHAPEAKIILSQNDFNDSDAKQAYNTAIASIATLYNLPMIIPYLDPFFSSAVFTERYSNHPTYVGYAGMADSLVRLIRKSILAYKDYFKVYTTTPLA